MITLSRAHDLLRLRRLALSSQGLLTRKPFGRGLAGAINAIAQIGYVQIDTISVVERAHNHVLQSRVPGFVPAMTNQMLVDRDIFEYWSHAAAFIPITDYKFSLPYKQAVKNGKVHWFKSPDKKLMKGLLDRVRTDGPLRSRDLEAASANREGWWDWKPAKKALEQLYMQGDLMVSSREGFQKAYDLTERVLPSGIDAAVPSTEEFAQHLLQRQLGCHGCMTLRGISYLRKDAKLREAIKSLVDEGLATNDLEEVQIPSGDVLILPAGTLDQRLPRVDHRMRILSPFDNAVIQRDRLKALFDFNYQIECYVPAPKRKHGYFSLPLLYGDAFVGRMDCKAHRKDRHFEIKALHCESAKFEDSAAVAAFKDAALQFSEFNGCDRLSLTAVYPKRFAKPIQKALKL
ncbi:crosslink repair DNA glycosylase YcaQ family protein [Congregibacter brevis]|uniref:Crosslink repair DNA glycosylase YcaQ family protein n=1 Tax=Congregibacter brevis TaxID=3081201 RepID=A0ABZ0IJ84_9GAMM|nr:crosslink repair DNA glycosylase YcaQ family protein [Congregibacter sp. IMCC45268]